MQLSPLCHHERQGENARFVKTILFLWSGWYRDPPLAGADFAAGEISMEQRMYFPIQR